jgi:hypothetical protein
MKKDLDLARRIRGDRNFNYTVKHAMPNSPIVAEHFY